MTRSKKNSNPADFVGRPVWAEVSLSALTGNLHNIRDYVNPPSEKRKTPRKVLSIVKGTGYGHGGPAVAKALEKAGSDWFGVASAVKEVKRASLPEDVALITNTVPRERIVLAQTPQVFDTRLLKEAFARAEADGVNASDEAGLVERLGHDVHVVHGSERNIKITKPADMELARFYLHLEQKKA